MLENADGLPPAGTAAVPSNWTDHGLSGFNGRVLYEREFDVAAAEGPRTFLVFEGVDYFARVVLNGRELGRHEGCWDQFEFDVTADLRSTGNVLQVEVDAPDERLGDVYPARKRQLKGVFNQWDPLDRWMETTGGIWGDVLLERRPDPHLTAVLVTTLLVPRRETVPAAGPGQGVIDRVAPEGATHAWVRFRIDATAAAESRARLHVEIDGHGAEREVRLPAGTSRHELVVEVPSPRLWWTWDQGEPVLVSWRVRLGDDLREGRTGLREVSLDEATGVWTLNGRPVSVRGSSVLPEKQLSRYSRDRAAADAALVRSANLNFVRVVVHVAHDALYDALDEAGVLAWQDFPLQWNYVTSPELAAESARQARAMVRRLGNHPSVALWSCQNEAFRANELTLARVVEAAIRESDHSRPVHLTSHFREHAYPGWFTGHAAQFAAVPGAPLVTEFGALAPPSAPETRELVGDTWPPDEHRWKAAGWEPTPGYHVAGLRPGSDLEEFVERVQRYQASLVQRSVEAYRSAGVGTVCHFLLMDGWPHMTWSVVSYARVPKLGYEALRRAMQPVLICGDLLRDELGADWDSWRFPPIGAVRVINDLPRPFTGARWRVELAGTVIAAGTADLAAGAVTTLLASEGDDWPAWDPPELAPGEHELRLVLEHEGAVLSENSYRQRSV